MCREAHRGEDLANTQCPPGHTVTIALSWTITAACLLAGLLALPISSHAGSVPARSAPPPQTPSADTQRLRALSATFAATPRFEVDTAALQRLAANPVALPPTLTPAQTEQLLRIGKLAGKGDQAALRQRWGELALSLAKETTPVDVNALVQWVLRASYLEQMDDLRDYADKVKFFNGLKSELRSEIRHAQSKRPVAQAQGSVTLRVITGLPTFHSKATRSPAGRQLTPLATPSVVGVAGLAAQIPRQEQTLTLTQLEQYIGDCETRLRSIANDAQLANVDLQNPLQEEQQVLTMLSGLSRSLHDTPMETLRKSGG